MSVAPDEPGASEAPRALDEAVDRLFEFNSSGWIDRARTAIAERPLGRLGQYELLAEIGRGGQGEVYRAIQPGTGRQIALKRIAGLGLTPSDVLRTRFTREVEALIRLSHPNVVTVHAAELIDGHTILVMELVNGEPIDRWADDRWRESPNALREVLEAFAEACDGVAHAHARGVVHRDIKPSNVLVVAGGRAKVLDFGIAKLLDEAAPAQQTASLFVGTPGFAAPERFRAGTGAADTRSEVYSLGVLLFRLIAGAEALESRKPDAIEMPAISKWRAAPRECDWIVDKATRGDPAERYQTVESIARDVRALLAGEVISAAPPSATYRLRKAMVRYRYLAAGTIIVGVALTTATAISLIAAGRARSALEREREALSASKASEQRAVLEASRQEQVSALMRQVLGASGAVGGGRPDITVREALDNAVKARFPSAGERSELDPSVEAVVRAAIGDTYLGIGRNEEAITHLRVADEIYRSGDKADSKDHVSVLYLLGRALRSAGRLPEAEVVLRRVVEAQRAAGDGAVLPLADALSSLGVCLRWQDRGVEAEECYREAMALYERGEGPDSLGSSTMAINIAILRSRRGDHDEAVAMARRAIGVRERKYAGAHPDLSGAYAPFGNILWAAGRIDEGERYLRLAIAMDREMSPEPSLGVAQRIADLAGRLSLVNRLEEAVVLQREALAMHVAVQGASNYQSLGARTRLSQFLRRSARLDEAEQVCMEFAEAEIPATVEGSALLAELAEVRLALGCREEAERSLLLAWEKQPAETEQTWAGRFALAGRIAEFHESTGNLAEAAAWRERASQ